MGIEAIEGVKLIDNNTSDRVYGKSTTLGQEDFMELLLKELSYQDPMNPMDNKEFTAQMTQFASLESLSGINDTLNEVLASQHSMQNATVANLIGKSVQVDGDTTNLNGTADIGYELADDAATVNITVRDGEGSIVRLEKLGANEAGSYSYIWDGKDDLGNQLPNGNYTFEVEALDRTGEPVEKITKSTGKVTNAVFEEGVTSLILDNTRKVYLADVQSIGE